MTGGPPRSGRRRLAIAAALAAAMAAYVAFRLKITTDITHFLPAGADQRAAELSRRLADSTLTRTLILSIGAPEPEAARQGAAALAARLAQNPEVAWIARGPTDKLAESVYALYAPRLADFASDRPEAELPAALSDAGLAAAARALKRQLALPLAPLVTRLAPSDPLQWFPAILRRFEHAQAGALAVEGDQLMTPDHRYAIVFLATKRSPFDSGAQAPFLAALARDFDEVNRAAGGVLTLERAGVAPIALDAEQRIRGDLTRLSTLSTVGVIVVFLLLFGSLRGVLLAMLPVVAGALTATTVGLLLFGKLHGMTLAIGSTLIGVAIDYPILLMTHRVLSPDESSESVVRRVWMGIFLGGITTAAGFAALGWTSFPGVREMAVTSTAGILAALIVTRTVLPPLLAGAPPRAPVLRRGAALGERAIAWLQRHPFLRASFVLVVALISVAGLPRLRWQDSLAALNAADPALKAETDRVKGRVSQMDEGRLVIATGPDLESALRVNDEVALRLDRARADGKLEAVSSLHAFLWSAELQRRSRAAVAAAPDLGARTLAALAHEGFHPEVFAPWKHAADALSGPPAVPPLTLADLQASPLVALIRPFIIDLDGKVGVLTFVRGGRGGSPGASGAGSLASLVGDVPDAVVFDQTEFLDSTYARFRVQTLQATGVGLALILVLLFIRYRRLGPTLAAFLPAVLAAAATLGVLGAAGVPTNLLHVLSLLIVLSMAVDYGVFLVECARTGGLGPTTMSLVASASTALLTFGLLAVSRTPALRAIGLTTGIGIILSLGLAPLALVMTRTGRLPATGGPTIGEQRQRRG
jgi:predicted exporter